MVKLLPIRAIRVAIALSLVSPLISIPIISPEKSAIATQVTVLNPFNKGIVEECSSSNSATRSFQKQNQPRFRYEAVQQIEAQITSCKELQRSQIDNERGRIEDKSDNGADQL